MTTFTASKVQTFKEESKQILFYGPFRFVSSITRTVGARVEPLLTYFDSFELW